MKAPSIIGPYLLEQCRTILEAEPALARAASGEAELVELVHDVRVAIRRLRSTLRTFGKAFEGSERDHLITEAGWFATQLGELRDLDVIGERINTGLRQLDTDLVIGPVAERIHEDLQERRAAQRGVIAGVVLTERHHRLRDVLARWQQSPPWSTEADTVDVLRRVAKAKRRLKRRRRTAVEAVTAGDPAATHLSHQARKAAKRHRYAVELAAGLVGDQAESIIARRKRLQDDLGSIQDSVVTQQYLVGLATRSGNRSGRNAFTYGVLAHREQVDRGAALRTFAH